MKNRAVAVIGDVHGCRREFEQLLEKVDNHGTGKDCEFHYVLVGDLVDRGPDSAQVVELATRLHDSGSLSLVLGNHDEMLLQALLLYRPDLVRDAGIDPEQMEEVVRFLRSASGKLLSHWMRQGGIATITSYGGDPWKPATWRIPAKDIRLLARAPLVWTNGDVTVTHARADAASAAEALVRSDDPWNISESSREMLLWNRETPTDPLRSFHVSGHTARIVAKITDQTAEIDTGCCFGNTLSAFLWDERILLSVPSSLPGVIL